MNDVKISKPFPIEEHLKLTPFMDTGVWIQSKDALEDKVLYALPGDGIYHYEVESVSNQKFIVVEIKEKSWPEPPERKAILTFTNELMANQFLSKFMAHFDQLSNSKQESTATLKSKWGWRIGLLFIGILIGFIFSHI